MSTDPTPSHAQRDTDDFMRLVERYTGHIAVAELHDANDAHRARDRELRKADDLRGRIRAELERVTTERDRLADAARALDAELCAIVGDEDDMTPAHRDLAQALAALDGPAQG